jgi:hypothetical protein
MRCSQAAAAQACGAAAVRPPLPGAGEGAWQRRQAQLELCKALSLGDAAGYERWLSLMANVLAQQRDEVGGVGVVHWYGALQCMCTGRQSAGVDVVKACCCNYSLMHV